MSASLDNVPFRINPTSVRWGYSIKLSTKPTMGGKVFQIYGVSLGDLSIEGSFGARGPAEQREFFDRIVGIMEAQIPTAPNPEPVQFVWPERNWDFWVYVKKLEQVGASTAVYATNENFNPKYRLTLFIQEDNGDIKRAVQDSAAAAVVARFANKMGWAASDWSGAQVLADAIGGQTIFDAIANFSAQSADVQQAILNGGAD